MSFFLYKFSLETPIGILNGTISAQSPLLVRLLEDRSWSRENKTLILDMSPKEKNNNFFFKMA